MSPPTIRLALVVLAATALACQPLSPPRSAPRTVSDQPPPGYVPASRSAAECTELVTRSASWTTWDVDGLQRAAARSVTVPPFAKGRKIDRQFTIRLRVDERGQVMRDSVFVTGNAEASYMREFRATLQKWVYWPAVYQGCAVRAITTLTVSTS